MLKIFFRTLRRNKVFSIVNIGGLAIGLATCLLMAIYIVDEYSFDKHHKDVERLFRVASKAGKTNDGWAAAPAPLSSALKAELPEVEYSARLLTFPDIKKLLITRNDNNKKQFYETDGYYADADFFRIFTYSFLQGNPQTVLSRPNSIVISAAMAEKYFGKENPVNKPLSVRTPFGDFNYNVTGVFDPADHPSHIPSNFFLSMQNGDMGTWVEKINNWATTNIFFTYIKLKPGTQLPLFEKKLGDFFNAHAAADLKAGGFSKVLYLQPVKDIYLHSSIGNEIASNGNINYLYILASIAGFILLIACINFMNLSTAQSERRAREVGVRKVLGADKQSLVFRFLSESFLLSIFSLLLALVLAILLLPLFNQVTQKQIHSLGSPVILIMVTLLTFITGILAGLYPSFYLSAFRPVSVLKGKIRNSISATTLRKGLVVFQFTISACLILGAIIIWKQMNFMKNQQLGFNKEQQVAIPMQFDNTEQKFTALKNELLLQPGIKKVTAGSTYPGIPNINDMLFYGEGKSVNESVDIHLATIGDEYLETLGIQLLHGRTFSKQFTADSNAIILNEAALKQLGYDPATAVGRNIRFQFENVHYSMNIVGVVKNFNFESLHKNIEPYGFATRFFANKYSYAITSFSTTNYPQLIKSIQSVWQKIIPETPFEYSFIDQDFQRNYEKDERTSKIVIYFTCIAIVIACLGLFALAAYSAEQRVKEIGIRKVLGASATNVTILLSKDFLKLVTIAILIASPLAWFIMQKWLQNFAYQTPVNWWLFVIAGGMAIFIAIGTVSFHAIKSALANPVESLRTE